MGEQILQDMQYEETEVYDCIYNNFQKLFLVLTFHIFTLYLFT